MILKWYCPEPLPVMGGDKGVGRRPRNSFSDESRGKGGSSWNLKIFMFFFPALLPPVAHLVNSPQPVQSFILRTVYFLKKFLPKKNFSFAKGNFTVYQLLFLSDDSTKTLFFCIKYINFEYYSNVHQIG